MACTITVDQPTGLSSGGVVTSITAKGTISDGCPGGQVVVEIACAGKTSVQAVVAGNSWFAFFPNIQNLACVCNSQLTVTAKCVVPSAGIPQVMCEGQFKGTLICQEGCLIAWGLAQIGDCLPDGKRPVSHSAIVSTGGPNPVQAQLELLGTGVVDLKGPTPGAVVLTFQGNLAPAVYTFKVSIFQPQECASVPSTDQIDVPACVPQPTGACCIPVLGTSGVFTCEDGLTAAQCQAKGGTYMGDNTNCANVKCSPPGPPPPPPPPPPSNGGDGWCLFGRWLVIMLIAVANFLAMLLLCAPTPQLAMAAAVAAVLAATAFGLWWAFCGSDCEGWLVAWQAFFVSGVMALYLTGCCVQLVALAAILLSLAAGFFGFWVQNCKPDECKIAKKQPQLSSSARRSRSIC